MAIVCIRQGKLKERLLGILACEFGSNFTLTIAVWGCGADFETHNARLGILDTHNLGPVKSVG